MHLLASKRVYSNGLGCGVPYNVSVTIRSRIGRRCNQLGSRTIVGEFAKGFELALGLRVGSSFVSLSGLKA